MTAYTIVPSSNIDLSRIAEMYGCECTFTACAIAAGLPTSNIDISDFAGLSAAPAVEGHLNFDMDGNGWVMPNEDYQDVGFGVSYTGALIAGVDGSGMPDSWLLDDSGNRMAVTDSTRFEIICTGHEPHNNSSSDYTAVDPTNGSWAPIEVGNTYWFGIRNNQDNMYAEAVMFFGLKDKVTGDSFDFEVVVNDDSWSEE